MAKYKATAYIRLSYTDDRSSESDSVSNQRRLIENFVERNPDIEVVSFKVDDGYSGIIFDRPAFKEMMQDVTNGEINCVIVKDLSRLGREYIETGRYLRKVFPAYGVRFIAITDNIDTAQDSSGDDLTVSVKNIMNEAYCRDISVKTRTALDVKRRKGDFVGAFTVYGYIKSEDNRNQLFLREAKQFGLDGLYHPTEPERKMVQAQIDKVWGLIGITFDEFPFPVSGVYLFDDSVCSGDYEWNDGLCANQEKVNSNRKRAIIGIGKSAIEAGEEYTAFLLLHEITHAATATTGHNDRFHQYLNYLLFCFNQQYGTSLENDYSGD